MSPSALMRLREHSPRSIASVQAAIKPAEDAIRDIRRATRRHFSAEEKIRIVLEGLRGEKSIAELCRREGIASSMYYGWSKEFLEAEKAARPRQGARRDLRRGEGPSSR